MSTCGSVTSPATDQVAAHDMLRDWSASVRPRSDARSNQIEPCLSTRMMVPASPGEVEVVRAVFDGMSEESRRRRFLVSMPMMAPTVARALTAVDGVRHVAIVAQTAGDRPTPVGIGRYVVTAPGTAEISLAVIDSWHRRGVGRRLLRELARTALRSGITTFEGTLLADNVAVRALLESELHVRSWKPDGGVTSFIADLGPAQTMWKSAMPRVTAVSSA